MKWIGAGSEQNFELRSGEIAADPFSGEYFFKFVII